MFIACLNLANMLLARGTARSKEIALRLARTREIGIRMALGAHPKDVFKLIMKQGALQTALAVSVGVLLALAAGQVLGGLLVQVSPVDPGALLVSSALLAAAALLACFFPAQRATKVSPMTALRTE